MADNPVPFNTGLTEEQIGEAFDNALNNFPEHQNNEEIHITAEEKSAVGTIGGKASASDLVAHTDNTEIHITAAEKAKLAEQNKYLTPEIIAADSDLNDYSGDTLGDSNYRIYYTQTQAVTNTVLNKPADWVSGTFVLEVMRMGGSQYMQRLTQQTYSGSAANIYIRTKVHSTTEDRWNPWFKLALTKIDAAVE